MDNGRFKVVYHGEGYSINSKTFILSLTSIEHIINCLNEHDASGTKVNVMIEAISRGSFDVNLKVDSYNEDENQMSIINNTDIPNKLVSQYIEINEFKKHIGSEDYDAKENGDKVIIKNSKDGVKSFSKGVVDAYNNDDRISGALSENYSALDGDSSISKFEIIGDNNAVQFDASRADFGDLSAKMIEKNYETRVTIETVDLKIMKIVFEGSNRKWDFLYKGSKITARIEDSDFMESMNNPDVRFGRGDALKVELATERVYDALYDEFVVKGYVVQKVIGHIKADAYRQMSPDEVVS